MLRERLGPYEFAEEIGKGGMATVYRAYQPSMDRYVAVKVIRPAIVEDDEIRERFQREARLIARLEHPHVLPVYDFDGSHDPPYIVMRYLEGGTLKEVLESKQLPLAEINYSLRQVVAALDYAHRQGVVHRDIKPSNIMVDLEGNAFVMDFGIARFAGGNGHKTGLTGQGTSMGTPDYMAPEQIMGVSDVDHRADLYSLGVIVFQMLTGSLPYVSDSPMATMLKHLQDDVPSAQALNATLSPEIDAVLAKAMAKDPAGRYLSVTDFYAALSPLLGEEENGGPAELKTAASELARSQATRELSSGTRADSQTTPTKQNKTITAVHIDAAEYVVLVELAESADAAWGAVNELWDEAEDLVRSFGGVVLNRTERHLLVLWGAEQAREDDAEQALRATLAITRNFRERVAGLLPEDDPLPIRIGVNTGLTLLTHSQETNTYTASGSTISLAGRLAENADGIILITHDTFRQVQGVFTIEPDRPVRVRRVGGRALIDTYQVMDEKVRAFRIQPRNVEGVDTRMIGRSAALEQIQKAFFYATEDSETQIVTITGEPGMGKTRLLFEFATWAELRSELYFIFRVRAAPGMAKRPFALWRDLVSFRFAILDSDKPAVVREKLTAGLTELIGPDDELAHLLGYLAGFDFDSPYLGGDPQRVAERARLAVGRFFNKLGEEDPIVMQLDEIQHADDASLDLLMDLVHKQPHLPLLIVGTARPSLFERRPAWGKGLDTHNRIDMGPLDKRDSRELVAELLQRVDKVPLDLRDLIVDRAEGNPFYMEELVKMLIEDRVIQKVDEKRWQVEGSRLERLRVPPTLLALLQARFDSLLYPEKLTLQRAAVYGRIFYDGALRAMDKADDTHVDDLPAILDSLVSREFIDHREISAFEECQEYIFRQAMLRDAILETLLQSQARRYYKETATWMVEQSGERAGEYDAIIAEHYEQAGELVLAASYFRRASVAANNQGVLIEAIELLEHGMELLDREDDPAERLEFLLALGATYGWKGDYETCRAYLNEGLEMAQELDLPLKQAQALSQIGRLLGVWLDDLEDGLAHLQKALEIARRLEDENLQNFILRQFGNILARLGEHDRAQDHFQESLALTKRLANYHDAAVTLSSMGENARVQGDFESALIYYKEALKEGRKRRYPGLVAMVLGNLGAVYLEQGKYELARKTAKEGLEIAQDIGTDYLVAGDAGVLGGVAVALGEDEAARRYLVEAFQLTQSLGSQSYHLVILPDMARLKARENDKCRAIELLGLGLNHPSLNQESRYRTEKALVELSAGLDPDEVEAALARGAELDLDSEIKAFLFEYMMDD